MNYNALKGYIEKVYELESQFYKEKILIKNLRYKINEFRYDIEHPWFSEKRKAETHDFNLSKLILFMVNLGIVATVILIYLCEIICRALNKLSAAYIIIPVIIKFSPIILAVIIAVTILVLGIKRYLDSSANINEEKLVKKQIYIFQQELKIVKAASVQTKKILRTYYKTNIIARKYWYDLPAISSFHEYLSTGRTKSLAPDGMDQGAYHIFEKNSA